MVSFAFTQDLHNDVTILKVAPDLFCVVHSFPWPANSLIAVMENGEILLVDTPYTSEATESVISWIDKTFGNRNIKAVNSHFHTDRLGGNEALLKRNIPIYSSELTPKAIQTSGKSSLEWMADQVKDDSIKQNYLHFKYTYPTIIFNSKKGLVLTFGNEKVQLKFLGAGHSMDNLFIFFPKKKLIFGGCAILALETRTPGNVRDGNKEAWGKTLDLINTNGYHIVIPGHGKMGGVELIKHTKEILTK